MKKLLIIFICSLFTYYKCSAQWVLSSHGACDTLNSIVVSYTTGEVEVQTLSYQGISVGYGVQQPTSVINTGLDDFGSNNLIKIWPNPSVSFFNLEFKAMSGSHQLSVSNSLGDIIWKYEWIPDSELSTFDIQTSEWASGVYFVKIIWPNSHTEVKKVLVTR